RMLRVAIFSRERSDGREGDVNRSSLLPDAGNVVVHRSIVERVDDAGTCAASSGADMLSDLFDVRPRPAGEEDVGAFSRELPRDSGANRPGCAEDHRTLAPQEFSTVHAVLCGFAFIGTSTSACHEVPPSRADRLEQ